eukprot:scaffold8788_cov108-Isochrysis_galbana.AAC.6
MAGGGGGRKPPVETRQAGAQKQKAWKGKQEAFARQGWGPGGMRQVGAPKQKGRYDRQHSPGSAGAGRACPLTCDSE